MERQRRLLLQGRRKLGIASLHLVPRQEQGWLPSAPLLERPGHLSVPPISPASMTFCREFGQVLPENRDCLSSHEECSRRINMPDSCVHSPQTSLIEVGSSYVEKPRADERV